MDDAEHVGGEEERPACEHFDDALAYQIGFAGARAFAGAFAFPIVVGPDEFGGILQGELSCRILFGERAQVA